MPEDEVVGLLQQMLTQMDSQQQALVRLTEVLDRYLKDPVKVDVVANAPKVSLTDHNKVGIDPDSNHVLVDNFPEMRDRNAPGVEAFQQQVSANSGLGNDAETAINVPPGKRLVIEYVSVLDSNGRVYLRTVAGGINGKYPIAGSQVVRIYADPGPLAVLRVEKTPSSGLGGGPPAQATVVVSGHLVKL